MIPCTILLRGKIFIATIRIIYIYIFLHLANYIGTLSYLGRQTEIITLPRQPWHSMKSKLIGFFIPWSNMHKFTSSENSNWGLP